METRLALRFGNRSTFAFELGNFHEESTDLRTVDVYVNGRWLTCDDNVVYLPQFINSLNSDLDWVISPVGDKRDRPPFSDLSPVENHREMLRLADDDNDLHLFHRFMDWGPTSDNVSMHMFRVDGIAYLPFSFWRETHHEPSELGKIFDGCLTLDELRVTLHGAAWKLMWDWYDQRRNGVR